MKKITFACILILGSQFFIAEVFARAGSTGRSRSPGSSSGSGRNGGSYSSSYSSRYPSGYSSYHTSYFDRYDDYDSWYYRCRSYSSSYRRCSYTMGTGYSISVELFFILLVFFFPFLGSYSGRYGRHRAYYLWAQNWHYRPKFFDLKGNIQRSIDRLRVLGSKDSSWCIDQIRQGAFSYFHMVQKAWSNNDLVGLERLVHPKLFPEWRQEIESFKSRGLKNKVDVIKVHALDVVDFVDDPNDESDRIFLRIHAQIVDAIVSADGRTQSSEEENFVEYWILARAKGYWRLLEIQSAEVFESEHPVLLKA